MTASQAPTVRVLDDAAAAVPLLLAELHRVVGAGTRPVVSFATGGTYSGFLRALGRQLQSGELPATAFVATHLDEYEGFAPERRGGMVHELCSLCPPFAAMLARDAFVPVPNAGDAAQLVAHEQRLQRAGGVALQFLGIGRNGHIAFNEPGTAFELGCHTTELAATTREDARARFAPDEPPRRAITSGIATILAARRLVLCAFGANKAAAVRAMLHGPIAPTCPASALRRHGDVFILLDRAAAAELERSAPGSA